MNKQKSYLLTAFVLAIVAGFIIVPAFGWKLFVGIFLLIWANNIAKLAEHLGKAEKAKQDLYKTIKDLEP